MRALIFFFPSDLKVDTTLLLFILSVVSDSLQPHGLQHPGFLVFYYLQEFAQNHMH